ncbi:MAG: acyltransferase [Actinomycetes bacterium]
MTNGSQRHGTTREAPRDLTDAHTYKPALNGLRAIAVVAVVAGHAWWSVLPGGGVGVDLFFALSGYLITGLLLAEVEGTGGVDLPRFWGRRALRLLPALALMLTAVVIYFRPPIMDVVAAAFYFANWRRVGGDNLGPLGPTWSLSVEEQFYILWPVIVVLCMYVSRRMQIQRAAAVAVASILGCVLSPALRFTLINDPGRVSQGTDTRLDALMSGCLLASLIALYGMRVSDWLKPTFPFAALFLCAALFVGPFEQPLSYSVVAIASGITVGYFALSPNSLISRLLSLTPIVWLGIISYGIYLWHFPVQFFVNDQGVPLKLRLPAVLAITIAIAALSFYFMERPLQRKFRHFVAKGG